MGVLCAGGVWLIQGDAVEMKGELTIIIGWLVTPLIGIMFVLGLLQLLFGNRTPYELSPNGFVAKDYVRGEIPWNAVSRLTVWTDKKGEPSLLIQLTDEALPDVEFTWPGRFKRWLNKKFGFDDIAISAVHLDITFPDLLSVFRQYLTQHQPSALTDDTPT